MHIDCAITEIGDPSHFSTTTGIEYYSGDCCDPSVQDTIRDKFIQIFLSSGFSSACTSYPDKCHVDNVKVTCGGFCARLKKRDADDDNEQQFETKIEAEITIDAAPFLNMSSDVAYSEAKEELGKFSEALRNHLPGMDVGQSLGLVMTFRSIDFGKIQSGCAEGHSPASTSYGCGK